MKAPTRLHFPSTVVACAGAAHVNNMPLTTAPLFDVPATRKFAQGFVCSIERLDGLRFLSDTFGLSAKENPVEMCRIFCRSERVQHFCAEYSWKRLEGQKFPGKHKKLTPC